MPFTRRSVQIVALHVLLGVLTIGCIDISAGNAQFVDTIEKRFSVAGTPSLKLGTFDGSVEVSTWDRPEVLVTIERRAATRDEAERMAITAEQNDDEIRVEVRENRSGGFHFNFGSFNARIIVSAPARARVAAATGDGRIVVRDVEGDLNVRTGDGAIQLERVNGAVDALSGDGSITVDGQIQRLNARSGDGRVRIHAVGAGPTSDWSLSTGDGSVVLEVPDGFGAELDATTGDGRVQVQDLPFERASDASTRRVARGRLGNGGPKVSIRSGDGSIVVRRGTAES